MTETGEPYVEILVQPKAHGQRFRYKCESRSAGCLIGDGSSNETKVYPTIEIKNLNGQSAIVVVSCVSKDPPYYPHPHNLVGTDCKDGVCTIRVKSPRNVVTISGIGVQCCKRQEVPQSLNQRNQIRVDPFSTGPDPNGKIDLSVVRLCFQVFLPDASKRFTKVLKPVVSEPIIDKKTVHDLIITRLSANSGSMAGGDDMIILCEKVRKDDIQVRFCELSDDGELLWESYADLNTIDVHHQYAISFKTPPYREPSTEDAVNVFIQLFRPSSSEFGDPKPFIYKPIDPDPDGFKTKRKKANAHNFANLYSIPSSLPSTLDAFHDEDDTSRASSSARQTRRPRRGTARGSLSRPPPAAAQVSQGAQAVVAGSLPAYSFDNIGQPWNFPAPQDGATDRYIHDEYNPLILNQTSTDLPHNNMVYTIDPASFAMLQRHTINQLTPAATMDEEATPQVSHDTFLSQLSEYFPGGQEGLMSGGFTSAELFQQIGNASHISEVTSGDLGLGPFFNSGDVAATIDQLINDPTMNPPHT